MDRVTLTLIVDIGEELVSNINTSNCLLECESRISGSKHLLPLTQGAHNSESKEKDSEDDGEGGRTSANKASGKEVKSNFNQVSQDLTKKVGDGTFVGSSIHYVDACTLWKFPIWLVQRLDCSKLMNNEIDHMQEFRKTILYQLKATSTDLIMYATVRREFLRTILVIELNNVARIVEVSKNLSITADQRSRFFSSLKLCVTILEDENKPYSESFLNLAQVIDELYANLSPSAYFQDVGTYTYNNIYCSYLVPGSDMQFTEMCCGGIVDNTWFSLESKYRAMVMVTPHVYDDPRGLQRGILKSEKYRVEAYFDVDRGHYTAFDKHFKSTVQASSRGSIILEHLVFSFFSKSEHFVEEKSVFLMNGPESKGNLTFAKIYNCLVKSASL